MRPGAARPGAIIGTCAFLRMHPFAGRQIKESLTDSLTYCSFFSGRLCTWTRLKLACSISPRSGLYGPHSGKVCWRQTSPMPTLRASSHGTSNRLQVYCREASRVGPVRTQPSHLAGTVQTGLASLASDPPKARGLDGNTVALDQQLTKVADTETTQSLVTSIWKKYMGMFSMALGRSS